MSAWLGTALLIAAMAYALYALFAGMRHGTYVYFGKRIARAERPVVFWFCMAVMVGFLLAASRILPYFLVAL